MCCDLKRVISIGKVILLTGVVLPSFSGFASEWTLVEEVGRKRSFSCCALSPEEAVAYSIESPLDAKAFELTARMDLQRYLSQVTKSGKLLIDGKDGIVFHVGDTDFSRKVGLDSRSLLDEEWVVKSFGNHVVINGGGTRGCLYAVYHFLEDWCGVRWWADDDEDIPDAKYLAFPALDCRGKPNFAYRDIYRDDTSDPRVAVRCRVNGNGVSWIPPEFGGGFVYGPPYHCHTWDRYFPFEKHGKAHPEWYALRGGKRVGGQTVAQMCLTCPGLADEFAKAVEKSIAQGESEAKARGLPAPRIYDISMNDNRGFCECETCKAETEKYGHSGRQLRFVNAVARKLGAKHPDLLFSTFAYYHSEPVPTNGVRAADNVVVKLCNTRQNMSVGIGHPDNRFMHDQTIAWSSCAKNLFVWEYAITFNQQTKGFPFPSEFHIVDKYRFYARHGVKGFLIEHENPAVSDMYELKYYLERRALEDPEVDGEALIGEFMSRYYGAAGAKILEARRYLERICRERAAFVTWFPTISEFNFIRREDVVRMKALFAEAEASVRDNVKLLGRVRRARESLDRVEAARKDDPVAKAPEPGVAERPFFDFPVTRDGGIWRRVGGDFRIVDDPDACNSVAAKVVAADEEKFAFPFVFGVYDMIGQKAVKGATVAKASGEGYQWYSLGRVTLPQTYYLYFSRQWTLQMQVGSPEMDRRPFEIRAHIKFTGPLFGCRGTENAVFVDRVVFEDVRPEILTDGIACREPGRYIGWPSAACLQDGSVLAVFSGNRLSHVCPSGVVQMVRSSDNGRTWTEPLTIGDTPIDDRDASILQMRDGELLVTWFTSIAYLEDGRWKRQDGRDPKTLKQYFGRWCTRSRDGGRTWSAPQKMTLRGSTPHGPILLKDGSLLNVGRYVPGASGEAEATAVYSKRTEICCERSTDGGLTWVMLCPAFPDTNGENSAPNMFHEPHVAELHDGTLVALVRYHGEDGCLRQSVSRDGGRSWSPMKKTTLLAGPSAMHMLTLPDNRLLVTYSRRLGGKGEGEFAAFSSDEGVSWSASDCCQIHEAVPGAPMYETGYPATVLLRDDTLLTVFYEPARKDEMPALMATRWRIPIFESRRTNNREDQ